MSPRVELGVDSVGMCLFVTFFTWLPRGGKGGVNTPNNEIVHTVMGSDKIPLIGILFRHLSRQLVNPTAALLQLTHPPPPLQPTTPKT